MPEASDDDVFDRVRMIGVGQNGRINFIKIIYIKNYEVIIYA